MKLLNFIQSLQPLINISELERVVGCPKRTIHNALLLEEKKMPSKWILPTAKVLCQKLGSIKIGIWNVYYGEFDFWAETDLPEIADEMIEHEETGGIWVEYRTSKSRMSFDDYELTEFLT